MLFDKEIKKIENKNKEIYNVSQILVFGIRQLETKIYDVYQITNLIVKLDKILNRYENGDHTGAEEIDIINIKKIMVLLCDHLKGSISYLHEDQEDLIDKQISL